MNERFEYMTETVQRQPTQQWLNERGSNRWELGGVFMESFECFRLVFKRTVNPITESLAEAKITP